MSSVSADTKTFRAFNRMYTRFLGTLQEGLLNTDYSLAEARVLYELATRPATKAKEIADCLEMDAGYLSRILSKFETNDLLKRKADAEDNRAAELKLTRRGAAAFQKLDKLSNAQAEEVFKKLSTGERARLIDSMQAIQTILSPGARATPKFILRQPRAGDMGWVVSSEGAAYAEDYGWDTTFEALVARIVSDFVTNFDASKERCWIAELLEGQRAGHIFLVRHPDQPLTAKLRLLFVERSARGTGLGQALVSECVQFARAAGYQKVVLWTQAFLSAAGRIYEKAGFRLVDEYPNHSFGKDMISQNWELELNSTPPSPKGN